MNLSCRCHGSIWSTENKKLQHEANYWKLRHDAKCMEARLFRAAHHQIRQGSPGEVYEQKRAAKLRQLIKKERQEVDESSRQLRMIIQQQWEALRVSEEAAQERLDQQLAIITEREERLAVILSVEE